MASPRPLPAALIGALLAASALAAAAPSARGAAAAARGPEPLLAAAPPTGPAAPAPPGAASDSARRADTAAASRRPPAGPAGPGVPARRPGGRLPATLLDLDSVRLAVMEPNGVFPGDLDLLPPAGRRDAFRLARVEAVLRDPFRLEGVVDEVLARTDAPRAGDGGFDTAPAPPLSPDALWPLIDGEPVAWPEALPGLPGSPDSALGRVRASLAAHLAGLSGPERDFLFREASSLFLQDEEDTTLGAVEGELRRLEDDARAHRILELARRLDRPALQRAASAAWGLQAWILDSLGLPRAGSAAPGAEGARVEPALERLLPRLRRLADRAGIPLKVGTPGPDRHRPDRGIWIDPGGDDQWDFAPTGKAGEFLLILDLAGNDLYRSTDSLHRSPGNLGVSLLADLAGDDRYLGRNYAFGSALFGYSHLYDAAGRDAYEGRCASLGFAAFGVGVLQDEGGSDVYGASLLSQGASSVLGLGLLLDRSGDDRYLALPTFQDDLRYQDHHIHMVQGFSTGLAPDYSGGIGVLRDGRGNDVYLADIFGQGSGYWYALGLLLDESGDDRYAAHQYAQGAGVHIAVGAAVDWQGNDHWASKGVSQGCGHDLGFGLLHDPQGDDTYLGTDKVQGSGSANGLGVLHDGAGNDHYTSINPGMALGDADMRRDRGSFGFFLDARGRDRYTRRGDGQAWRTFDGKVKGNGYGLDRPDSLPNADAAPRGSAPVSSRAAAASPAPSPAPAAASPAPTGTVSAAAAIAPRASSASAPAKAAPVFAFTPPAFTRLDTLFLVAATGEPRFQTARDSSERLLRAGGAATLDYLLARRLTGQTPRQRHYVERVFTLVSDSGRNPEAAWRLEAALPAAPDSVKVQLLRIGSALGDTAFRAVARKYLAADSVEVRKLALRSLGAYPSPADRAFLLAHALRAQGLERQMALWALAQHPPLPDVRPLLPLLRDPRQYNRQLVRRLLAKAWGGDFAKASAHAPRPASPHAPMSASAHAPTAASAGPDLLLEWVLLASEMPGSASKTWLRKALPSLDPEARVFYQGILAAPASAPGLP